MCVAERVAKDQAAAGVAAGLGGNAVNASHEKNSSYHLPSRSRGHTERYSAMVRGVPAGVVQLSLSCMHAWLTAAADTRSLLKNLEKCGCVASGLSTIHTKQTTA